MASTPSKRNLRRPKLPLDVRQRACGSGAASALWLEQHHVVDGNVGCIDAVADTNLEEVNVVQGTDAAVGSLAVVRHVKAVVLIASHQ